MAFPPRSTARRLKIEAGRALVLLVTALPAVADAIPATPVMTVYRFNGPAGVPYYAAQDFARHGTGAPVAGALAQGTSVLPCLVLHRGKPLTDSSGTPYVGFEIIIEAGQAKRDATKRFRSASDQRAGQRVRNHHCPEHIRHVMNVRRLFDMKKAPFFDPPAGTSHPALLAGDGELDSIVRAFHESEHCRGVQAGLMGRRKNLEDAWKAFQRDAKTRWSRNLLERARHLDFVMRTTLFEGHLERGCGAYGACERNIIALSIRNRARERCSSSQGCTYNGDFTGVASKVSQYNIWDEVPGQISGLAACFLRTDLADQKHYAKLRAMYEQSRPQVEKILFGQVADLAEIFPGTPSPQLVRLRHYYHPPAMGKCFPRHPRLEYISGAIARRGKDFALIANTRVDVGRKRGAHYEFRAASIIDEENRDSIRLSDAYQGFLLDGRKISLQKSKLCRPYGAPKGCSFKAIGRYRRVPGWLSAGRPLELTCQVVTRGTSCLESPRRATVQVGGVCDTDMQPVAGVP